MSPGARSHFSSIEPTPPTALPILRQCIVNAGGLLSIHPLVSSHGFFFSLGRRQSRHRRFQCGGYIIGPGPRPSPAPGRQPPCWPIGIYPSVSAASAELIVAVLPFPLADDRVSGAAALGRACTPTFSPSTRSWRRSRARQSRAMFMVITIPGQASLMIALFRGRMARRQRALRLAAFSLSAVPV